MFNKKFALMFTVMLLALSVLVLAQNWTPPPPQDDEGYPPLPTYDYKIQITKVDAKIDGKKDTIGNSGEKISKEAKENSDIEFEIEVKNVFEKEIKDVEVTVTIKDIDDGDDLDDESSISKLAPGESKKVDLDFDLPLKVDDGDYDVKIDVEGKDEDNNIHIANWVLTLEVKKEQHNVKITKALVSPSTIQCGRTTNLDVELLNLGREEEEVQLEIKNDLLGIDLKEKGIELDTGTDKEAEYQKTFSLNIPQNIGAGTYTIEIKAHYNKDKSIDTKTVNLVVGDCLKQTQSSLSIQALPPTASETLSKLQTKTPNKTIISMQNDESMILLLSITLIIVLALIIFLLGVTIVQLKK